MFKFKNQRNKKARHKHDASENDALNWNHFDPYFKKPVIFGSMSLTTELTLVGDQYHVNDQVSPVMSYCVTASGA